MKHFAVALILTLSLSCFMAAQTPVAATVGSNYTSVTAYDPARDAAKDIDSAVAEASRTGRRVMVEIGGKWCIWCSYFDKFFETNADVREVRDRNFVMVKVNFSPENKNEAVISRYGKVPGYPHIFILGADGKLLQSQDTSKLEQGRGYNKEVVQKFLSDWAPKKS